MIDRVFAAIVLVACLAMLARLALGERRRRRLDAVLRRFGYGVRNRLHAMRHWRAARRDAERARKLADELIQRARTRGKPEDKVTKPTSYRRPPRDKMH